MLTSGKHAWSYANPTGAPARASATATKPATPAPTEKKEWSDMASKEEFRAVIREENERSEKRIVQSILNTKIPAQGFAKGEQKIIDFLRWQRHDRARSEAADKAIAAALDEGRLKGIVSEAVSASQTDTVTVVSDARVTRQVPADQVKEVQA